MIPLGIKDCIFNPVISSVGYLSWPGENDIFDVTWKLRNLWMCACAGKKYMLKMNFQHIRTFSELSSHLIH